MKPKHLALIGLGPHARTVYYPALERHLDTHGLTLEVLVELQSQTSVVTEYLQGRKLRPKSVVYVNDAERDSDSLAPEVSKALNNARTSGNLDAIIISTEPKAHKPYALWAMNHDVDILIDKPLTAAPLNNGDPNSSAKLRRDYAELVRSAKGSKSNVTVHVHRRYHDGYRYIMQYLRDAINQYRIPITYLDMYHADGMWNMPSEFHSRENHPYKYGYGEVMHSGYHLIDLFTWFLSVTSVLTEVAPTSIDLFTRHTTPFDFLSTVGQDRYKELFHTSRFDECFTPHNLAFMRMFGETDVQVSFQVRSGAAVMTTGVLTMLQNSFSRRAWSHLPLDTYKGNGRVRHERCTVQLGGLLNLQVHSYRSESGKKSGGSNQEFGDDDHFQVYIFRNNALIGGELMEKLELPENAKAREGCIVGFLDGAPGASTLEEHALTVNMMAAIYECIALQNRGECSVRQIALSHLSE